MVLGPGAVAVLGLVTLLLGGFFLEQGLPSAWPDQSGSGRGVGFGRMAAEGDVTGLLAQTTGSDSVGVLIGLAVLALWGVMIWKFFEIAGNVASVRDMVSRLEDHFVYGDDDEDAGEVQEEEDSFTVEANRLREMGRLREEGLLSEEEFTLLKEGMLGRPSRPLES